jgi:hypothetical protein
MNVLDNGHITFRKSQKQDLVLLRLFLPFLQGCSTHILTTATPHQTLYQRKGTTNSVSTFISIRLGSSVQPHQNNFREQNANNLKHGTSYRNETLFPEVSESSYKQGTSFIFDHSDIVTQEATAEHLNFQRTLAQPHTKPMDGENRKQHTKPRMDSEDQSRAEVDVHPDGDEKDRCEAEEDDSVDDDGHGAGVRVAKLDDPALAWDLEEEARRQKDEQHQRDEHAGPVLHFLSSLFSDTRMLTACLCSFLAS